MRRRGKSDATVASPLNLSHQRCSRDGLLQHARASVRRSHLLSYSTDWTLGAQHAPPSDFPESEAYWKSVGGAIEKVMMTFRDGAHVDKVLLFGESVDEYRSAYSAEASR